MVGFAGFDTAYYPGDGVVSWVKANTNLAWCGYYLAPAPSHHDLSWMGKRERLQTLVLGLAPIYVGEQTMGSGSRNPSAAKGTLDGNNAADLLEQDKFGFGASVFLDLENGPPLPPLLGDYAGAWCDAVASRGFAPGVYCSHAFAADIRSLRPNARIWAFKVTSTDVHEMPGSIFPTPDPSGSGYSAAVAWQREQNARIVVPPASGGTLQVDLSVALTYDPGASVPPSTYVA